ncbi:hypothetical protein [Ferviditalea candida]|uniref:Phage protein n=1 Tax=Ferviditalea candida TaxID=3108399 RepID=A0ABU5ZFN2_9BACL|nr:hypothetical protein [Paenibacillaceae bacterium T2]
MKRENTVCVQKVKIGFDFLPEQRRRGETLPLHGISMQHVTSQSVRFFKDYLTERLERIAGMMELLASVHPGWTISGNKIKVVMETDSYDFNDALKLLRDHGYEDDEFSLQVEYERKWGML